MLDPYLNALASSVDSLKDLRTAVERLKLEDSSPERLRELVNRILSRELYTKHGTLHEPGMPDEIRIVSGASEFDIVVDPLGRAPNMSSPRVSTLAEAIKEAHGETFTILMLDSSTESIIATPPASPCHLVIVGPRPFHDRVSVNGLQVQDGWLSLTAECITFQSLSTAVPLYMYRSTVATDITTAASNIVLLDSEFAGLSFNNSDTIFIAGCKVAGALSATASSQVTVAGSRLEGIAGITAPEILFFGNRAEQAVTLSGTNVMATGNLCKAALGASGIIMGNLIEGSLSLLQPGAVVSGNQLMAGLSTNYDALVYGNAILGSITVNAGGVYLPNLFFDNSNFAPATNQLVRKFADIRAVSQPDAPPAGYGRLYFDATTGVLSFKKADGTVVNLEA